MDKDIHAKMRRKEHEKSFGYIISIIVNILLICLFGHLTSWFGFLTSKFNAVLWLFYISFSASILFNLIYLVYRANWFKAVTQLLLNIFSLIIFYVLLKIFPFNLNEANMGIAHLVIYAVMLGIFIGVAVELFKFFYFVFSSKEASSI